MFDTHIFVPTYVANLDVVQLEFEYFSNIAHYFIEMTNTSPAVH